MSQQFPTTEEEWKTHVLNIHGTPFEQLCEHHLRQSADWQFKSSRYPVEFPPSYSPLVSQTKNSELDLWGLCQSPGLQIELLVECKKNNPDYTDWVFFFTTNPAPLFPSIRTLSYRSPGANPAVPWGAHCETLYLAPPPNTPITSDGREIKGDYQTRSQQNQNNGKQLTKTSNAAITEAAYQIALATQALLHQERRNREASAPERFYPMPPFRHVFLPLIVTTATLWTCHFQADKVDIAHGVIPFNEVQYQQHPYLFCTYALPPILQFHPGENQWVYRTDAQWEALARFSILVVVSARPSHARTRIAASINSVRRSLVLAVSDLDIPALLSSGFNHEIYSIG